MNILKTILFTGLTFLQANLLAEEWVFEEYIDKENNELNYTASITKENLKEYISIFCSEDSKDTMFLFSSIEEKSKNEIKKINIYFDDLSEFYLKAFKSDDLLYFSASTFKNNDVNKEYNFKEFYNKLKYNNYLVIEVLGKNKEMLKYTFDLNNSKNTLNSLENKCEN